MADKTIDMTANEALDLLMRSGVSHPDYAKALDIVKHDSALWGQYQEFLKNKEKEELSLAEQFDSIVSLYETTKEKVQKYSDEYKVNIYGKETRAVRGQADKSDTTPNTWQTLCDMVEIDAQDENGQPILDEKGNRVVLSAKEKNEWMAHIFAVSKATVAAELVGDKNFAKMSEEDGQRYFRERVNDTVVGNVATAVVASDVKMPEGKETEIGSPEYTAYVEQQSVGTKKSLEEFVKALSEEDEREAEAEKKEKDAAIRKDMAEKYAAGRERKLSKSRFHINPDMILLGTLDAERKIAQKAQKVREGLKRIELQAKKAITEKGKAAFEAMSKKMSNVTDFLVRKAKAFEAKADKLSKGKYSQFKAVVPAVVKSLKDSSRDNMLKIGTNIALGGAVGAIVAAGSSFAGTAVLGYGLIHAASSWVWPIVAEKRKARRLAREAGKTISNEEAWALACKTATQTKTTKNGKEYNPYAVQGVVNSVLGIAGGVALKHVIDSMSGTGTAAEAIKAGQRAWRAGRVMTPAAAQFADAGVMYMVDPNDETNRQRARQTAIGGLITTGVGLVSTGLTESGAQVEMPETPATDIVSPDTTTVISEVNPSLDNIAPVDSLYQSVDSLHVANPVDSIGGYTPIDEIDLSQDADTLGLGNNGLTGDEGISSEEMAGDVNVEPQLFPREWNEDMGISKKQYNTLVTKMEGSLVDPEGKNVTLDRAYQNLTDDIMEKHFKGFTKEQVLYRYNRLSVFDRNAVDLGEYCRENPNGAPFSKYNSQLKPLMNLLGCGEEPTAEESAGMRILLQKDNFDTILAKGDRAVEDTGSTLADGCDENKFMWRKIPQKVPADEPPADPTPIPEPRGIEVTETPLQARAMPNPPAQQPTQPVAKVGVASRVTTDGNSAHTGHGSIVQKDVTDTRSGQNMLNNAGYDY